MNPAIQDKKRYHKVRPKGGGAWAVCQTTGEVEDFIDGNPADDYEVQAVWMTPKEYDALKEHEGW